MEHRITIRSYHKVFRVDRRIYRIDTWAVPFPGGIPLRGVVYFTIAEVTLLLLSAIPLVGLLVAMAPPPLRYALLPLAAAVGAMQVTPDDRTAPRFAWSWLRLKLKRERPATVVWKRKLPVGWDVDSPEIRKCYVAGPAKVTPREPMEWRHDGRGRLRAESGGVYNGPVVVRGKGAWIDD